MSSTTDDRNNEERRVRDIIQLVRKRLEHIEDEKGDVKSEIVNIKTNFWDDVTLNFEDAAESAESHASMKQQAELLSERERSYRLMSEQIRLLHKFEQSPYFGRIDISEDGGPVEAIYLGVGSLLDDNNENYLIYDWRAPISSVYYDYGPGPITYRTPSGVIHGEMTLKRQYNIRYGNLVSMFDTGVTIGDEILQEVLGKHSDSQMKSIVATIQQEQNAIIRNEQAKLLVVQGSAGSGKTSAALQRVAYLLYRYRESLNADQIVLFSPNPMFNSYVSTVLPELGEQNMQQTTYQQYLEHRLGRKMHLEDPFTQMEYSLTQYEDQDYEARMASIHLKSSTDFMNVINDYVKYLSEQGMKFKNIVFRDKVLISHEQITEQFYRLDPSLSIPLRLKELTEWLLKELTALGKLEQQEAWVDEELELLDTEQYAEAFQHLINKKKFNENSFNDFQAERDFLANRIVQQQFKKLRRHVKQLRYVDVKGVYKKMFIQKQWSNSSNPLWTDIAKITLDALSRNIMLYEDATPYLYLKEKLEGFQTNTSVKYVFIDEGQDYSAFQLQYMRKIFPRSRMTIVGDLNQSIFVHSSLQEKFTPFENLFSEEETERMTLLRSYRSTHEIIEFTAAMIEGGDQIIPFNRHGRVPEVTVLDSAAQYDQQIDDKLHHWIREGYTSIAIICKTAHESKLVFERLQDRWKVLRLVDQETVTFQQGIMVIPAYLAKGVEFDAVMIYDASSTQYHLERERKLFYTACTRAMHELHLFSFGEPSPFIPRT
ncbi:MAG: UvrD-helicase domain-containing protein [Candidatus Pristimantibacillus lignocellulolyticus]|uniref:UvrD-helicase domain-containing protein n=1 Tax=Candidatus Pristimantibacillus lignocellulolyticus TaxID=2994561 RepID=A0A9J6ZEH5_9BACL|nr:MAG: UvrD-helicase domain-containing protein [Candidatus Pristimantibacillus lignocellulolyticus]